MKEYYSRILIGMLVLAIGILSLLSNFGVLDYSFGELVRNFWPIFIIYWGLEILFKKGSFLQRFVGLFIALIGVVLVANRLEFEPLMFDLSHLWQILFPMVFILAGISLLTGKKSLGKSNYAILSGIEKKREQWAVESENYTAFLGGIELDMSKASFNEKDTKLYLTAVFGGIEIKVPEDLKIICEGKASFGGIEQLGEDHGGIFTATKRTVHSPDLPDDHPNKDKTLYIYSSATFGGVEIDF